MHAKSVKRTNRIVLVSQRVHDDKVLVFVVFGIPQRVARGAGRHEAERLVDRNRAAVLFRHAHPDAVHAQAGRFGRETVRHDSRHQVARVAAPAVVTAQHHLDAGGARPAIDVDQENHADDVVCRLRVDFAVLVMVGVGQYRPCDGAAGLRIAYARLVGLLPVRPRHRASHPRVYDSAFRLSVLAGDLGGAIVGVQLIHARQVVDAGRAQVHHLPLDRRYGDLRGQLTGYVLIER